MLPVWISILIAVVVGVAAGAAAFFAGVSHRRNVAEAKIGSAEEEAKRLINDAMKTAQQKRKEAIVEAKDAALQMKAEADKEIKERRNELNRQERRLDQKEETIDRKTAAIEQKEEELRKRVELTEARLSEIDQIRARELDKLETIAGLTSEEAKQLLLGRLDEQLTHEKAMHIAAFETQTKDQADTIARELISQAIARCAADHSSEATVSVVALPSDEMKGRIIGREGRNIRALETATGVDLIIDDTPEAITLSSFDPVRREIARMTLEKLISDGRIHPARIEETVEKSRRELELMMKREGEKAMLDVGIHGLHPDLIKLLGRLRYRTSYGQNVLNHSLEVAYLSGIMAAELGVNVTQARRAGLLHDIGKALDHEIEGSHISIGVDIARKYKENPAVIHAIEAHHGDVEPKTPLAFIVMAADAISAARPGARRENLESYIKRLESLEEISNSFEGVERSFAIQAGREVRIMVKPEAVSDDNLVLLAHSISRKIEEELDYPGQIKVNVIRESRAVEYAK
jgi:ribonuclease Y